MSNVVPFPTRRRQEQVASKEQEIIDIVDEIASDALAQIYQQGNSQAPRARSPESIAKLISAVQELTTEAVMIDTRGRVVDLSNPDQLELNFGTKL